MASPMVRVPEALKEVVQKLAEIHRQGDKRREVEAGLHRLLAELTDRQGGIDVKDSEASQTPEQTVPDDTTDSTIDDTTADIADNKIDSKTASTSVVISDSINVEEVVNRLAILEEKLAALEPQARTDDSATDRADDKADNKADDITDSGAAKPQR